jgi:hypothetical protein
MAIFDVRSALSGEPFALFDLEFTCWEGSVARGWSGPGEAREIVQIGAVRVRWTGSELVEEAAFDVLCFPVRNPTLSNYFVRLTGISQSDLESRGIRASRAAGRFSAFVGAGTAFSFGADADVVAENGVSGAFVFPSLDRLGDVSSFLRSRLALPPGTTSGELAERVGAVAAGTVLAGAGVHDALHDARSLARGLSFALALELERGVSRELALVGENSVMP